MGFDFLWLTLPLGHVLLQDVVSVACALGLGAGVLFWALLPEQKKSRPSLSEQLARAALPRLSRSFATHTFFFSLFAFALLLAASPLTPERLSAQFERQIEQTQAHATQTLTLLESPARLNPPGLAREFELVFLPPGAFLMRSPSGVVLASTQDLGLEPGSPFVIRSCPGCAFSVSETLLSEWKTYALEPELVITEYAFHRAFRIMGSLLLTVFPIAGLGILLYERTLRRRRATLSTKMYHLQWRTFPILSLRQTTLWVRFIPGLLYAHWGYLKGHYVRVNYDPMNQTEDDFLGVWATLGEKDSVFVPFAILKQIERDPAYQGRTQIIPFPERKRASAQAQEVA